MPVLRDAGIREPASWILAVAAMTLSIVKAWNLYRIQIFVPVLAAVTIGFAVHELAHRNVARRYGYYAEFIATPLGLLITAATGLVPGIVILAPGYVAVYAARPYGGRGLLESVAAGPASNILVSMASLLAYHLAAGSLASWLLLLARVNAWMALFNLLPFPPLDGFKIFRGNTLLWTIMMASSIALMLATGGF